MTPSRKRLMKWLGYPLLGLVTFVFAVHYTFPYGRVKDRLVEALSTDYDVSIADLGPGIIPGHYTIKGLTLSPRAAADGTKPPQLTIDRLDINVGILALIGRKIDVGIDAVLGDGRVTGRFRSSPEMTDVDLETQDLPLESIPGAAFVTGGAPIKGGLVLRVKLALPQGKFVGAQGTIELSCSACTIGDGVTKVRPVATGQVNAFNSQGFTLPRIKLGQIDGKLVIKDGVACIDSFATKSPHGELTLDGGIKFADPFGLSQVQLYARLKLTDEFHKESPGNAEFDILLSTGARQPDGWDAYVARSSVTQLRWIGARGPAQPMKECQGIVAPRLAAKPAAPPPPAPATLAQAPRNPIGASVTGPAASPPPPPPNQPYIPPDGGPGIAVEGRSDIVPTPPAGQPAASDPASMPPPPPAEGMPPPPAPPPPPEGTPPAVAPIDGRPAQPANPE